MLNTVSPIDVVENISLDFCQGVYDHKTQEELWLKVFAFLRENSNELTFDREAIHTLWTVNGGNLRGMIKNDDLVLEVLLKFLPKYEGEGLIVYRGECRFLFEENKIGFCWTPEQNVARKFARGLNAIESGGVLLKAYAPQKAVISSPNEHSSKQMKEHEYTCNPKLLENIEVVEAYDKY